MPKLAHRLSAPARRQIFDRELHHRSWRAWGNRFSGGIGISPPVRQCVGRGGRFRLQVYTRTTGGVETLARDEFSNSFSDTVATLQEWLATPSSAGSLSANDRIVVKVSARRISGPTNVTVTLYTEGSAHASQIQTTIASGGSAPISATPPLSLTGGTLVLDASALNVTYNCGRLAFVIATALSFKPYNGDRIKINGVIYSIPAAGIAGLGNTGVWRDGASGQNLSANVTYLVFAWNNAGTITAEYRQAAVYTHMTSTTPGNVGVEVSATIAAPTTPQDTHTLIGMIRTDAGAQFVDSATNRLVISWFNRRNLSLVGAAASGVTTSSTGSVELTTAARVGFINWGRKLSGLESPAPR